MTHLVTVSSSSRKGASPLLQENNTSQSLRSQIRQFEGNSLLVQMLDGIPEIVLVLNHQRRVVFANRAALGFMEIPQRDLIYGLQPGDILNCSRAMSSETACGAAHCKTCGLAQALLNSLIDVEDVQECRILQQDGSALDLCISTRLLHIDGGSYSLITIQDISHHKRQLVLERLFFHDILNTASLLKGYADIIDIATPKELEVIKTRIKPIATRLINEIEVQRLLTAAEDDTLA